MSAKFEHFSGGSEKLKRPTFPSFFMHNFFLTRLTWAKSLSNWFFKLFYSEALTQMWLKKSLNTLISYLETLHKPFIPSQIVDVEHIYFLKQFSLDQTENRAISIRPDTSPKKLEGLEALQCVKDSHFVTFPIPRLIPKPYEAKNLRYP